jgi:hypothetical protein
MKRAKVYLNNGEVADIKLMFHNTGDWINDIISRGIMTSDSYFPYHSISYILFEDMDKDDEQEIEVELEPEPENEGVMT